MKIKSQTSPLILLWIIVFTQVAARLQYYIQTFVLFFQAQSQFEAAGGHGGLCSLSKWLPSAVHVDLQQCARVLQKAAKCSIASTPPCLFTLSRDRNYLKSTSTGQLQVFPLGVVIGLNATTKSVAVNDIASDLVTAGSSCRGSEGDHLSLFW